MLYAFLHYSELQVASEAAMVPEACLVVAEDEPTCGALSFDSTDDGMVCVETYEDGKLRWACS